MEYEMSDTVDELSKVSVFVRDRIKELQGTKLQKEIAREAGFPNPNILSMLKQGDVKLSLDRVPLLAKALDVDPAYLFRLAIEQFYSEDTVRMILSFSGSALSKSEKNILEVIRSATGGKDPELTENMEKELFTLFSS